MNNCYLPTQAKRKGDELANLRPKPFFCRQDLWYLQSVMFREPSWVLLPNLDNRCILSEVDYSELSPCSGSTYQGQAAAEQSQSAEAAGALCRGVSSNTQVHSSLHDLSHQGGTSLTDQGSSNLGDLDHRPLPMLCVLQERANHRGRERDAGHPQHNKITHRHANANNNKNNIPVRHLFLYALV